MGSVRLVRWQPHTAVGPCLSFHSISPPGQIMQRKNIFLTLIIPGPNYPGENMNVYMQPLKNELQESWDNGFKTYDAFSKENFIMRVWYMYSMHDLPAYALFVDWCVHGRLIRLRHIYFSKHFCPLFWTLICMI